MKSIISTLITALALCSSCSDEQEQGRSIVVLHDVTHGDTTETIKLEDAVDMSEEFTYTATRFTYRRITDVDYNQTISYTIEAESEWSSNQYEREEEVKKLLARISSIDTRVQCERSHSAIWIPLWNTLIEESKRTNTDVVVYLLSDCIENDFLDLHNPSTRQKLFDTPELLQEQFRSRVPQLIKVKGIHLIICHQPKDKAENDLFRAILNDIYIPILSDHGVIVETRSHL